MRRALLPEALPRLASGGFVRNNKHSSRSRTGMFKQAERIVGDSVLRDISVNCACDLLVCSKSYRRHARSGQLLVGKEHPAALEREQSG